MRIILHICTSIFLSSTIGQVFGPEPFLNNNWIKVKDQTETRCNNTLDGKSHPAKFCRSKPDLQLQLQLLNYFEKSCEVDVGEHEGLELTSLQSIMR